MRQTQGVDEAIQAGELIVWPGRFTASAHGEVLSLSRRELELLVVLVRNPGRIIPRADLYTEVWDGELEKSDRSVDVYIHKLRSKLGLALPEWEFIHTHHGFGYRWNPQRSQLVSNSATNS
ncbi:MAG: winged helix-turn-helix domain-containing protein [Gaiellaceae bacterium]